MTAPELPNASLRLSGAAPRHPIEALDWARIAADLDAHGCATTGRC